MSGWLSSAEADILLLSLKVSVVAVLALLPVATMLALVLARGRFPGRVIVDALVHLPLVLPPVVTGWLLLIAFAPDGPIGGPLRRWFGVSLLFSWQGAAIAAAVMALPLMVRAIRLSIEGIDPRLDDAARTLGAGQIARLVRVTLPLALPGILAGITLGFARSIGEFGATITFVANVPGQTRTLPLAIYAALQQPGGDAIVTRLATMSVLLSLGSLILSEWLVRRGGGARAHAL